MVAIEVSVPTLVILGWAAVDTVPASVLAVTTGAVTGPSNEAVPVNVFSVPVKVLLDARPAACVFIWLVRMRQVLNVSLKATFATGAPASNNAIVVYL